MYTTYVRTQCRILCPISSDRVLSVPRVVLHDRTMDINRNRWNCNKKYMSERISAKTITKLSNATAAKKIDMDYSTLGRKWNACSNQSHTKQFVEWSVEHLVFGFGWQHHERSNLVFFSPDFEHDLRVFNHKKNSSESLKCRNKRCKDCKDWVYHSVIQWMKRMQSQC